MQIFAKGLQVYAFHGCSREEQTLGHRYRIDVSVTVPDATGSDDRLDSSVDYVALARIAEDAIAAGPFQLVEPVAQKIASVILEKFSIVSFVEITVSKLLPPAPVMVDEVGVTLRVQRA